MSIRRVFFDYQRPGLPAAVDYLVERFGTPDGLDLADIILAVPTSRAQRRLLELLVVRADADRTPLCPPRIVTVGALPELLYPPQRPFANDLTQRLAWIDALRGSPPAVVEQVIPNLPAADDLAAWLALGAMLARLHRELASENINFNDVAKADEHYAGFRESKRWAALAQLQQRYLAVLDGLELWDLQTARHEAIQRNECATDHPIVLLGTADLNRQQRLMLDKVAEHVTALVFAPENLADRFDEHGCLVPEQWAEAQVELDDAWLLEADDPAAQAGVVGQWLAGLERRYSAEQITVGVPDRAAADLVPQLEQLLTACGVPARYGVGMPVAQSSPYRFFAAVTEYLNDGSFFALSALVRHPAVTDWLAEQGVADDWLDRLDAYQGKHLPARLETENAEVADVSSAVERLLRPLAGKRSLDVWGTPLMELLAAVFGRRQLDRRREPDRSVLIACEMIRDAARENADIPRRLADEVTGPMPASEAIRIVLEQVDAARISAAPQRGAIEMLGWLDLPLDDAPALIVTGFNEGSVPDSANADMFLPNQLRRALGVMDNDRRYARDAYALTVLAASRERLALVIGRRTGAGDPLAPSRLLFACDDETTARRAHRFFDEPPSGHKLVLPGMLQAGRQETAISVPRPEPLSHPVSSMRVTEFRDYLACPYRYYLRHQLGLDVLADKAMELDGAGFGSLAHEVLQDFAQSPAAQSTDADEIEAYLGATLDRITEEQFGAFPLPAVRVQVEQLRWRLRAFALWQARWAADGWRIEQAEVGPEPGKAALVVDGQPMALRGRIDRIDTNDRTGERVVFDYKTSESGKPPEKTHRKNSEWIDLQLPLYRHLLAAMGMAGPVKLGYILLPKDTAKIGAAMAEWTDDDLASADATAAAVVRNVRAERFWPPASPPPLFSEDLAAICQDGQYGAEPAEDEGDDA